ncbi:Hsp20/alpha crystallin family protein [bacterium]|nr:Hsp20/alpha crystallin family protein [bacterium]
MLPMIRRFRDWNDPLELTKYDYDWDRWLNRIFPERTGITGYPVDIREKDGNVEVEAEMPGFQKEDIQVDVEDDALHIHAERKEQEKKGKEHLTERRYSRVERHFRLPASVDADNVNANLKDGVLFMTLPKTKASKVKHIEIK